MIKLVAGVIALCLFSNPLASINKLLFDMEFLPMWLKWILLIMELIGLTFTVSYFSLMFVPKD